MSWQSWVKPAGVGGLLAHLGSQDVAVMGELVSYTVRKLGSFPFPRGVACSPLAFYMKPANWYE